ncbi:hypothetical protein NDU88_002503 [Pleurodeles waltl]|uniref:Uncharacterized protein n=1 Tax=Pleurodeles waltl TaxID=8319 RepID=A0AAV7M666_PLEWA|nr:hypothetical protein NDU88_002503 [Pleurodeles waltl]
MAPVFLPCIPCTQCSVNIAVSLSPISISKCAFLYADPPWGRGCTHHGSVIMRYVRPDTQGIPAPDVGRINIQWIHNPVLLRASSQHDVLEAQMSRLQEVPDEPSSGPNAEVLVSSLGYITKKCVLGEVRRIGSFGLSAGVSKESKLQEIKDLHVLSTNTEYKHDEKLMCAGSWPKNTFFYPEIIKSIYTIVTAQIKKQKPHESN